MISIRTEQGDETLVLEDFERRVRDGRVPPSTLVRFNVLTGDAWVEARELELYRRLYEPARIQFTRAFTLERFPVFTALLCALQIGIYLSVGGARGVLPLEVLVAAGAKMHAYIFELGETWRLLSANVLHRDVLHLFFNLLFLFNVGGAVEAAYRWPDYVLILVSSAVGTTLLSVMMSDQPSVGASGMVLGTFGAASVFGYKYAELLPARYRRYFGAAVLPYALFLLYVGLVHENTDNWGHFGGLAGGVGAAMPLRPRLLIGASGPRGGTWGPLLIAAVLALGVVAAGPWVRAAGPRLRTVEDRTIGLRFALPSRWRPVQANHLGYPGWENLLGVRFAMQHAEARRGPVRLAALREAFVEGELRSRVVEGEIAEVRILSERAVLMPQGRAVLLDIALESRGGALMTRNLLIERGYHGFRVVLSAPVAWFEAYAPLFDRMLDAVALIDTESLVESRRFVDTFPGMSSAHVALADQLARLGAVDEASTMYHRALTALPEHTEAHYGLARLALDYDRPLDVAERRMARLYRRFPADATYALLLADLRQRLGQRASACVVVQQAIDRTSAPVGGLRARLQSLRCRYGGPDGPGPDRADRSSPTP